MSKNWPGGSRKGSRYIGKPCACLALNDAHQNGCRGRRALRVPFSTHFFARMNERRFTRGTARSRAWNVLSRAYAFSPLKCWFESVFKRNNFLCFMVHFGVETYFLWVFFFKGMPPWLGFAVNCSSLVHQVPFFSCKNLTK